jgi:hypothetical protein
MVVLLRHNRVLIPPFLLPFIAEPPAPLAEVQASRSIDKLLDMTLTLSSGRCEPEIEIIECVL